MYIDTPLYITYKRDADYEYLDSSKHKYILRFTKEDSQLEAFWSLTIYRLSGHRLETDPIRQCLINSPLFPRLLKDEDGGITIYVQRESPGRDKENNWLPPPTGLFFIVMRIHPPVEEAPGVNANGPGLVKRRSK
jgi:hypothetical protein